MKITIQLFATFRNGRFKEEVRECTHSSRVGQIRAELGILENEIGVALVNGRHVSLTQELQDGQTLALFPLLGGG